MITTAIPLFQSAAFLPQTLESLSLQTRRPDRVVLLDDGSTDATESICREFAASAPMRVDIVRNDAHLGLFGNFNRCLDIAAETDYLQILHADDRILPRFYEVMTEDLADAESPALAWCLDERIDERGQRLSVSGRADGRREVLSPDRYLRLKAEIANQAFCATVLKTGRKPLPVRFPTDMPILGDVVGWARIGERCRRLVFRRDVLAQYRWHSRNATLTHVHDLEALVFDEWRAMETIEALRVRKPGALRRAKLRGLLAVRSGIKRKRLRDQGDLDYARDVARATKARTGLTLWWAGQVLVELRDFAFYRLGGRRMHPRNVYS